MENTHADEILISYLLNSESGELDNLFGIVDLIVNMQGADNLTDELADTLDQMLTSEKANPLLSAWTRAVCENVREGAELSDICEVDTREIASFILSEYEQSNRR